MKLLDWAGVYVALIGEGKKGNELLGVSGYLCLVV